jgi:hypothetical protein
MKRFGFKLFAVAVCSIWAISMFSARASAAPLFFDNFESGLSAWSTTYGQIVTAPVDFNTHDKVLNFTNNKTGGDAFTISGLALTAGEQYRFSVDYLGTSDGAGFGAISINSNTVSSNPEWVLGYAVTLTNDKTWHSVTYDFTAPWQGSSTVWLSFEQAYNTVGTSYFDNVSLAKVNAVPVPAALWLLGSGLLGLIGIKRKYLG